MNLLKGKSKVSLFVTILGVVAFLSMLFGSFLYVIRSVITGYDTYFYWETVFNIGVLAFAASIFLANDVPKLAQFTPMALTFVGFFYLSYFCDEAYFVSGVFEGIFEGYFDFADIIGVFSSLTYLPTALLFVAAAVLMMLKPEFKLVLIGAGAFAVLASLNLYLYLIVDFFTNIEYVFETIASVLYYLGCFSTAFAMLASGAMVIVSALKSKAPKAVENN